MKVRGNQRIGRSRLPNASCFALTRVFFLKERLDGKQKGLTVPIKHLAAGVP